MRLIIWVAVLTGGLSPSLLHALTNESEKARIVIDESTGGIADWSVGGKSLVRGNSAPPISFSYFRPEGLKNRSEPRTANFKVREFVKRPEANRFEAHGVIADGSLVLAESTILYDLTDPSKPRVEVAFREPTELPQLALRQASWNQPLALNHRKRIYYRGDEGMDWDTRYFYQFVTDSPGRLLADPERNEWQHFSLDYLSREAFHLWRAEGDTTSPLTMQYGRHAPEFVQVYDEEKGVALSAPGISAKAPVSLRVFAPDQGEIKLEFHPVTAPALELGGAMVGAKFLGETYRFELIGTDSPEASKLANEGEKSLNPDKALTEPEWLRRTPTEGAVVVTGGYPFPPSELFLDSGVGVVAGDATVSAQVRPLAFWPDGSIKWALLNFPLDAKLASDASPEKPSGEGKSAVTFRSGKWLPVKIILGEKKAGGSRLVSQVSDEEVVVDTGALRFSVRKGKNCVRDIRVGDRSFAQRENEPFLSAEWLRNAVALRPAEHLAIGGEEVAEAFEAESIAVEEEGPYRAVVKLAGMVGRDMRVTLRLEASAQSTTLKVSQTSEFLFADPRRTFLTRLVFRLRAELGGELRATAGGDAKSFRWPTGEGFRLLQSTPNFFEGLAAGGKGMGPAFRGSRAEGWMQISNGEQRIAVGIRNFWQMAPKALAYDGGVLEAAIWPREAVPMDVRRYSNFPHRSQGESVTGHNTWVETTYYPQDPFVGIARTNEVIFDFRSPEDFAPVMADFQSPPLLYAGWERYVLSGITLPGPDGADAPELWKNSDALTRFWLFHQELHGWYGFWNYGNMGNYFRGGYGWLLKPDELRRMLRESVANPNLRAEAGTRKPDYFPQNDWAYDNGRWGWQNTEGLANLFFQNQYLRTGNRALYFAAEAMARTSRDVILRHSGQWMGRGTRHGVQAWSDGNHEERQGTPTEFKLNYFLSGDGRTRDVEDHLYQNYYNSTDVTVDAAHSARLGALLMHWEMTNDPKEKEALDKYVASFCSADGLYVAPQVRFPGPVTIAPAEELNSGSMFFHTFGGMHALIEYYQITKNKVLREAILKMADSVLRNPELLERFMTGKLSSSQLYWPAIGFAAAESDEPEKYRAFIREYVRRNAWKLAYNTVTRSSSHWAGPSAGLETNVSGSWFWTNWAHYFLNTIDEKDVMTPEVQSGIQRRESEGFPKREVTPSWQSELDALSDLQDYLGRDRPWNPAPAAKKKPGVERSEGDEP